MPDQSYTLYATSEFQIAAAYWQQRLGDLNVIVKVDVVELINAKFIRQHPELSLIVDQDGLWISANGMRMQPAWHEEVPRLKRANPKNELIARACHIGHTKKILDATAGLGHDSLLLAWLGAEVTLVERHPILFALLESTLQQAKIHPVLSETAQRIHLIFMDAETYLTEPTAEQHYDVIYLDPMFPQRDANQKVDKKQAKVKKQMQLLHVLLPKDGIMDLGECLLRLAQQQSKRVIVKRPRHAVFLDQQEPQHQWLGDACRFDAYFNNSIDSTS